MRIKISFEDIKKLYNYLDKNKDGVIGYDEFTHLLEERWRGIDPIEFVKSNLKAGLVNPMETSNKSTLDIYEDCETEYEKILRREQLAK